MMQQKLNRAMGQMRHLKPEMYKLVNDLWKNEINKNGKNNLFKFKFVLTYICSFLEEYLTLCEERYKQIEQGDADKGENSDIYVNQLQAALEGFIKLEEDEQDNLKKEVKLSNASQSNKT